VLYGNEHTLLDIKLVSYKIRQKAGQALVWGKGSQSSVLVYAAYLVVFVYFPPYVVCGFLLRLS